MKRSEFAKLVKEHFNHQVNLEECRQLSYKLEDIGMLAPSVELEVFGKSDNYWEEE